ncbi:cupin-like domain-containing protein [Pseudomonas sp. GD03858]|nr:MULTISPECIES: cupin domain-containing protein [unclassified Pseudomonas]MDH0646019.1 cupin-like domain-containing protein [Pseudomonas sp. GD03867]MDH0662409.1 cupin-like domain-containing protein [Pseudomonas sp. GD03858]
MIIDFKITKHDFTSLHQGKSPLLISNAIRTPLSFFWPDANEIIERASIDTDDFKILHNGLVPKQEYIETFYDVGMVRHRLIKPALYERMKNGATLIANKLVNEPKIHALARQVAQFTGRQTVCSVYAAFGRQASFQTHWDTRDIFAIQLIGRKRWIIYPPSFAEPLFMQQSKDLEQDYPCPSEPYMDLVLEPGDMLYLPRGWWHNPLPFEEETFHLSIGTFPANALDYVHWTMQKLPELLAARQAMTTFEQDRENLASLAAQLAERLTDSGQYQTFMEAFAIAQRIETPLAIDLFGNPSITQLPEDARLRLAANSTASLEHGQLIANGARINLDESALRVVRCIEQAPGIRLDHLANGLAEMDSAKLRALLHDLCRQDILELVRA